MEKFVETYKSEEVMFHTRASNLYLRNLAVPARRSRGNLFYPLHRRHLHDKGPALSFKLLPRIHTVPTSYGSGPSVKSGKYTKGTEKVA